MTLIGSFHWLRGHCAIEVARGWVWTNHGNGCTTYMYTQSLWVLIKYQAHLLHIYRVQNLASILSYVNKYIKNILVCDSDDHNTKYVYASKDTQAKF